MESKLDLILGKLISLEQDVSGMRQEMDKRFEAQDKRFDEIVAAFKENWGDMAGLYRRVRDDVKLFEERLEAKLTQVNQSIVALRDSLERQDFRSDELGRRIALIEDRPPRL